MSLTVVGGTYLENCDDPDWHELYGSGLRGAAALSRMSRNIRFISNVGEADVKTAISICETFGLKPSLHKSKQTISFYYHHPLSPPEWSHISLKKIELKSVKAQRILYYGMIEANISVQGQMVVYDPQNYIGFRESGSTAERLALVLNRRESLYLTKLPQNSSIGKIGSVLQLKEGARVVVIKDGSNGAFVFDNHATHHVPAFRTSSVWPIGSGDVFSAVFARNWMEKKLSARKSALLASQFTAQYCESRQLPLPWQPKRYRPIKLTRRRRIYLAGPFYTIGERWLINDLRRILLEFGNKVFSPLHEVGVEHKDLPDKEITRRDLEAIRKSDTLLAVLNGVDPGTLFEIGYAASLKKRIVVLAENIKQNDLTLLTGAGCEITSDLSTAIYKASW